MTERRTHHASLGAGWTGGQYSVSRALLGVYLLVQFLRLLIDQGSPFAVGPAVAAMGVIAAGCFAAGVAAQSSAIALLVCAVALGLGPSGGTSMAAWLSPLALLLALHACVPPEPYGSWPARDRTDPRGDWRMPAIVVAGAWILAAILVVGIVRGRSDTLTVAAFSLLLLVDPRWIPARWPGRRDRVFYDGTCGLCHGATRFILAEDRSGTAFGFAPLQGPTWEASASEVRQRALPEGQKQALPDSVVVLTAEGDVLTRSTAAIYVLDRMGGLWRVLGTSMGLVPRAVRDAAYDAVARSRYRIFGRRDTLCPILPPDLRSRFLDEDRNRNR